MFLLPALYSSMSFWNFSARSIREAFTASICASLPSISRLSFSASVRLWPWANLACSASKSISDRLTSASGLLAGPMR